MRNLVNEPIEDHNSSSVKGLDPSHQPLSESIDRGDGYVIFSPKDPEVGGTDIVLKWGGNPPEKNKQQQKDKGEKGKDQDKDKEKGEKGEEEEGEGEQDQSGQEEAGSEGTEGAGRGKEGGKEKGTQSDQKGGDKGEKKGEEEDGESEGDSERGGEKEGEEKGGERGGKSQGGEKGDKGKDKEGGQGGELGDLDNIRGQDILGGGRNRGEPDDEDEEDGRPRRPPHGPRKKDKRGKDKDKEGKDKSREPGEPGEPTEPGDDDDGTFEVSSDITDVPPVSEEEDPEVLDVIFGKDKKEVSQKENKVIHKSFVFRSGNESIEVFRITPKGTFSVGDRTHIRKLANLVYYLYEPYLKAPNVDLDPSASVIDSPISSRGLRSGRPHERPRISYGALSALDQVDFSKLIVFIDVSGSMDMVMVSRVINSYFQSVFTALKKNQSDTIIKALVVLHGTNAAVFGVSRPWNITAQTIAGVAESSRGLVGMGNGSESTLTHMIVRILKELSPIDRIGHTDSFINGKIPLIWISDFYWNISAGNQLSQFLRNKPALLISTVPDPEDAARGLGDKADRSFSGLAFGTARTIMSKVPYGALIYFPSFIGSPSSGSFTPGSSSGGSTIRVYAKGGAYDQLVSRRDKLGQISIVRIR